MTHLDEMIARCEEAIGNPDDQNARFNLLADYALGYQKVIQEESGASLDERMLRIGDKVDDATIRSMRTLLVTHKERFDRKMRLAEAGGSRITAKATSMATVSVSISQVFDLIDADSVLSEEAKATIQSLLADAKKEAVKKDCGAFAKIGAKIMEGVEKATPGVVSGVISFLASLATANFGE